MHVHTHILREYLQKQPDEVRELVEMQTLDSCQAETNLYSLYVGARMLWDPRPSPELYLREIARLVYGPKLEERVFQGLKAIADVRCANRCRGYFREQDGKGNGLVSFDQALEQSAAAWKDLKDVQLDKSYNAPLRFHRPEETLLRELKGHVGAVALYMQFLKDRHDGKSSAAEIPPAEGPFEYYERMQYLKPGEIYWPATVKQ
jgi:hypothetical protein